MNTIDIINIYKKIREHNQLKNKFIDKTYVVIYNSYSNAVVEDLILYFTKLKYELLKKVDSYNKLMIFKITHNCTIEDCLEELTLLRSREEVYLDTINLTVTEEQQELLISFDSNDFNLDVYNSPRVNSSINHDFFTRGLIQFCVIKVFNNYNYNEFESSIVLKNIESIYPLISSGVGSRDYIDSLVDETLKIS